jgi:hypothetical protein
MESNNILRRFLICVDNPEFFQSSDFVTLKAFTILIFLTADPSLALALDPDKDDFMVELFLKTAVIFEAASSSSIGFSSIEMHWKNLSGMNLITKPQIRVEVPIERQIKFQVKVRGWVLVAMPPI